MKRKNWWIHFLWFACLGTENMKSSEKCKVSRWERVVSPLDIRSPKSRVLLELYSSYGRMYRVKFEHNSRITFQVTTKVRRVSYSQIKSYAQQPVQIFFRWSTHIRVVLLSYERKTTDKQEQYDWKAEKNLDGRFSSYAWTLLNYNKEPVSYTHLTLPTTPYV